MTEDDDPFQFVEGDIVEKFEVKTPNFDFIPKGTRGVVTRPGVADYILTNEQLFEVQFDGYARPVTSLVSLWQLVRQPNPDRESRVSGGRLPPRRPEVTS